MTARTKLTQVCAASPHPLLHGKVSHLITSDPLHPRIPSDRILSHPTQECIYQKKVAEIKAKQAINAENGQYKVDKLVAAEKRAAERAARQVERAAEVRAAQAKYAGRR